MARTSEVSVSAQKIAGLCFAASPEKLQQVRCLVDGCARKLGCNDELVRQLVLVVDEACSNVIRHAYRGDDSGEIDLELRCGDGRLVFILRDWAEPVDSSCIRPRDLSECRPGGLGINFIDSVMDDWHFARPADGRGNILYMSKNIE